MSGARRAESLRTAVLDLNCKKTKLESSVDITIIIISDSLGVLVALNDSDHLTDA